MKASRLYIGAFALIVCAIAAFAVTSADSADATSDPLEEFADGVNEFSDAALGSQQTVISAVADSGKVTISVDAQQSAIDTVELNFDSLYKSFKEKFANLTVIINDSNGGFTNKTIINNGEPTEHLDAFLVKIVSSLKDGTEYSAKMTVQDKFAIASDADLKISFTLCKEFSEVFGALSKAVSGGPDALSIDYAITDGVFEAFGIPVDKIAGTTVSGVFDAFANGKGASVIFDSTSTAKYFNTLCDKINKANGFAGFLTNTIKVEIGDAVLNIESVTISGKSGFNGLMATLASATADFGKVSDRAIIDGGVVKVQPVSIAIKKEKQGDLIDTIGITTFNITYSAKDNITVQVRAAEGGNVTLNNGQTSVKGYAGTLFTINATPDSGMNIASIDYYVGDEKVDSLGTDAETGTYIHFSAGLAHYIVVTFNGDAPAPPTPVPPAPDDPDEPEDLPDDGVIVNPDGSVTTTVTDEDTGIKTSVTEKGGKVTEVISETESGTKYSSVGEGSTVTTTVWSSDLNGFMADALIEQADMITGGKTAELVIVSTEVNISADVAGDIAAAFETVTLTNADAHMEIPANVVKNLAKDGKLKITSKQATSSDMTDKQRSVVGNNYVLKFTATAGTTTVHELGDSVTIGFYYTPTTSLSGKHVVVKYVDDDGNTTDMQTTYANGRVTFVTDHFSVYFVDIVEDTPGGGGSSSGNNNILYIAVAAAAVAAIAVCIAALVYLKKD